MDQYERNLLDKVGRRTPFTVPEGYFDHFTDDLMARLPQRVSATEGAARKHAVVVPLWKRLRPVAAAASVVVVAGLSAMLYFGHGTAGRAGEGTASTQGASTVAATAGNDYIDGLIDECADYTMMDNEDMYAYVSGY